MRGETTAAALARRILWGVDEAMAGRPRPFALTMRPVPNAPVVAMLDDLAGLPRISVTPFAFYGEKTAALLAAVDG